ncbi:hypothetical protein FXV91_11510 [Methanosarcina sp. DH2]|uniref:hypothetical protein n=1 Tax=Methanosarcina sp. DH2 TaxID=2605639 RepID=UPI001E613899|nr:hypothetical protein [Methanosarcina sp. DH2]MCC4770785.1 hypothetical protein [Methanosarcina sp. DH2]
MVFVQLRLPFRQMLIFLISLLKYGFKFLGRKFGSEKMRKNNTDLVEKTLKLLDRIPKIFNITPRNTLKNRQHRIGQPLKRQIFSLMFSLMICMSTAAPFVPVAAASGGSYTLKWSAADPKAGKAPYLPTYEKLTPAQLACPGNDGRYPDPLKDAVAYGPTNSSSDFDAVASLAPEYMALGQIVPFEVEINVDGSISPENGTINFTAEWLTKTTTGDDFGYDPAYMVYCAFVDTADAGTYDPGENAKVDSFTSTLVNPGTSNEAIQGTFTVSGLDDGDNVIVEYGLYSKIRSPKGPQVTFRQA